MCSYGYVSTFGSKCNECYDRDSGIALAAVVAVIAMVACAMFLVYMMSTELDGPSRKFLAVMTKHTPMQTIKIIIVAWQILTQVSTALKITRLWTLLDNSLLSYRYSPLAWERKKQSTTSLAESSGENKE